MSVVWISFGKNNYKEVLISKNSVDVKNEIRKAFNIDSNKQIRLRNQNNSILTIDGNLVSNTKRTCYKLELVNVCDHISMCLHKKSLMSHVSTPCGPKTK